VIASSAIENMRLTRAAQINRLLTQSITFLSGELGYKADSTPGVDIHQGSSCGYSRVCFSVSCICVRYVHLWHYCSSVSRICVRYVHLWHYYSIILRPCSFILFKCCFCFAF
jgi:hypothetical protein